jgi:hypothetical protein
VWQTEKGEFSQNGEMSAKFRFLGENLTGTFVSNLEVGVAPFVFHLKSVARETQVFWFARVKTLLFCLDQ